MFFKRFRIKNFRSIVDTGWHDVASDNITGIIGQNESGKTSILEGLYSFYTGDITEDILRSDLSLPVVSCSFEAKTKNLKSILNDKRIPEKVIQRVEETGLITIVRTWAADRSNYLSFGDEKIAEYFRELEKEKAEFEHRTEEDSIRIIDDAEKAEKDFSKAVKDKTLVQKELNILNSRKSKAQKAFKRNPGPENKKVLDKVIMEYERSKKHLEKIEKGIEVKSARANELSEKARFAQWCMDASAELEGFREKFDSVQREQKSLQYHYEEISESREKRRMGTRLNTVNAEYNEYKAKVEKGTYTVSFRKAVTARILKGMDPRDAEDLVEKEIEKQLSYYTLEELAAESFKYIPAIELFEDFSSLLPNRIDLDDIFDDFAHVEGYKAARNFLTIAGLSERFFDEQSSRIMKQKIEKLNNEITLDFQDYWRQSIGKQNKIKINFELEHYDVNNPEKVGRPYLEFWIKDDQDRLYPKQRSRGVRWFLSFYLELKASALEYSDRGRVFLIDEPGLSLHARAQEDVLKVFEDIKENIQIIYTTHSPHLINMNKLYRLLAVQRAVEDDMKSETVIYNAKSLNEASTDTLSPIYTLMGTKMSDHQFVKKKNNVIVEDMPTYHYLKSFFSLIDFKKEIYFLPATDVLNVPTLVYLLLGWKLDYFVLLDDDQSGNLVYNDLKANLFNNDEKQAAKKLIKMEEVYNIEDLFSTIDFKNFILHERVGITESNSEYIQNNNLSRNMLASSFVLDMQNNKLSLEDFDEETRENIDGLVQKLYKLLS
ncbi:MAG: AAA family ATPase [Bacteroidales bacterium]|nr:AAA family ATPase [Bacteroidales bacterium]